ncbi:hypothetical protein ACS0TY_001602 [Phlomoides rotata]
MNIWLESDSSYVVNFLKTRPLLLPWCLLGQWHKIRRLMDKREMLLQTGSRGSQMIALFGGDKLLNFLSLILTEIGMLSFFVSLLDRGDPFSLAVSFVPKEGFLTSRFSTGLRPLDCLVVLWL